MKHSFVWKLILLALAYSEAATPLSHNICDTCKCKPSALPEKAKSIECTCDTTTRIINTTEQNMQNLPHVESFTVQNCDEVNFHKKSFGNSHDLSDVILKRVKTAVFPLGVFSKLDMLKIEDVEDLRLMENAFMGAEIGEIAIRNSTIHEIPTRALYDVKLRRLQLSGVNIGLIKSNSTLFVMGEQSDLTIEGCQVDQVEVEGLQLKAQKLRIRDSTLNNLAPSSTLIDAAISLEIIASTFGKSNGRAMLITSKSINIFNNTFNNIPITLGQKVEGGKITITNNFIHDLEFNPSVLDFIQGEFIRNSFLCNCALANKLESAETYAAVILPNFKEILKNNYCNSDCSAKVSVKDFLDKAKQECVSGKEVELCSAEANLDGVDASSEVSGRSGRRGDHDDQQHSSTSSTTLTFAQEGSPHTSGHSKYGFSSLLTATFLTTLFLLS